MSQQPSLSESLVKALEKLPYYALSYVVGFFILFITDMVITSLALACIFLSILTSPLIGLAVFLFAYTFIGILGNIANSIKGASTTLAQQINFVGQVMGNTHASKQ